MTPILSDVLEEASRLLELAKRDQATLALLGGVAVRLHAAEVPASLERDYKDLDFAVPKGATGDTARLLRAAGYEPAARFNAMNGNERMLFHDTEHERQIDVFVGSFRMCHEIPLTERLTPGEPTVPLAELVLTKLQIVQLNEKDMRDMVLLFYGHAVADHDDDVINGARIANLCSSDWGLWRTITRNVHRCLEHVDRYALGAHDRERVVARLANLLDVIDSTPKSRGWKLRARVGDRKRWYELPEEVEP